MEKLVKEYVEELKHNRINDVAESDAQKNDRNTLYSFGAELRLQLKDKLLDESLSLKEKEAQEINLLLQSSIRSPFITVSFWFKKDTKEYGAVLYELDDTIFGTAVFSKNKLTVIESIKKDIHEYVNSNAEICFHPIYVRGYDDILSDKAQEEIAYSISQNIDNGVIVINNCEYDWNIGN